MVRDGIPISPHRGQNLMHPMELQVIFQKPRTTDPGGLSERLPYFLDLSKVTVVDQVRVTANTCIPLQRGFLHQVAIEDFFSRHVLSWRPSYSLDTDFALDALELVMAAGPQSEIIHSDQGCQVTSGDSAVRLRKAEVRIS